ncbi:MAG: DUF222 domain-containing protein [Microbacteriaceae bacterium]|nr:DUF222 domain-containing protein [Microbacteriaceae bacterium]
MSIDHRPIAVERGSLGALRERFEAFARELVSAEAEAGADGIEAATAGAADARLASMLDVLGALRRAVDGVAVVLAAEVAERSRPELGAERLARRHGYRHADELVAVRLGAHPAEAKRLTRVGAAVVVRDGLGEPMRARCEHVAAALDDGALGLAAAHAIVDFDRRIAPRVDHDERDRAEELLVESAPQLTLRELQRVIAELEAHVDPDGVAPTLERHRRNRNLVIGTDADGMMTIRGRFDAETGAPIKLAIDAIVGQQLAARRERASGTDSPVAGSAPSGPEGGAAGGAGGEEGDAAVADGASGLAAADPANPGAPAGPADPTGPADPGDGGADSAAGAAADPGGDDRGGPVATDDRTIGQLAADALATLCRHALACGGDGLPSTTTTVVVRMSLDDLRGDAPSGHHRGALEQGTAKQVEDGNDPDRRDADPRDADPHDAERCDDDHRDSELRGTDPRSAGERTAGEQHPGASGTLRVRFRPTALPDSADLDGAGRVGDAGNGAEPGRREPAATSGAPRPFGAPSIDGFGPIDAATARRLAAAAEAIPIVLGGDGEVLDLGRRSRFFTRAQRLALVERDGGCAFCGLPPHLTEAHHVRWWMLHDGTTDLDNGVLLCTTCHHRVHEGWRVAIAHDPDRPPNAVGGGTVWFIPPWQIDLAGTPRLGGRKRFDPAFRAANPPTPLPPERLRDARRRAA